MRGHGPSPWTDCGTPAACRRHYRRGEKPCTDCLAANRRTNADKHISPQGGGTLAPDPRPIRNNLPDFVPYRWHGKPPPVARLIEAPEDAKPTLVVFDLNNLNAKPLSLIPKFKTKFKKATSIIGFLNHLQGDLKMKAIEAGCDTVMPRSAFSQSLPNLLRRYGLEEEDEYVPQPV